ncbi:MAG: ACT domain-containing protein [Dehalococcoidia bacterium]|nr:ACT domain-containing protein [Dehalococcoidia bacterium]
MRAIITVIGTDCVGIIAGVSAVLVKYNVNILDMNQTTMQGLFTMIMLVDMSKSRTSFEKLAEVLETNGNELGMKIHIQHEDVFKSMHRI